MNNDNDIEKQLNMVIDAAWRPANQLAGEVEDLKDKLAKTEALYVEAERRLTVLSFARRMLGWTSEQRNALLGPSFDVNSAPEWAIGRCAASRAFWSDRVRWTQEAVWTREWILAPGPDNDDVSCIKATLSGAEKAP